MTTVVASPSGLGVLSHGLRMLGNETRKGLQITWAHRASLIPQFGFLTVMYWVIQYFVGGGRILPELAAQTFVAYLAFVIAYVTLLRMAAGVLEEVFTGTFMQGLLSPLRPWVLSTGRLVAALVEGLLTAVVLAVLFLPPLSQYLTFRWEAVVPVAFTLADAAGFAMLIGGLALMVNGIGAVIHVLWSLLIMVNGSFIPVNVFPIWLEVIAKLWPTTLGVDATRQVLFDGASLTDLWLDYTLPLAAGHAALMLLLGWVVFHIGIRRGMARGRLGP
jgi:ABC-2 type transport system permease protein